jgi:hypothetical protein
MHFEVLSTKNEIGLQFVCLYKPYYCRIVSVVLKLKRRNTLFVTLWKKEYNVDFSSSSCLKIGQNSLLTS